jgi:hypothetical protein
MATRRDALEDQMQAAAAVGEFELAARLRDELKALLDADAAQAAGELYRQQPGAMGLGSSRQTVFPPPGWIAPPKPDLMTNFRPKSRTGKRITKVLSPSN